MGAQVEYIRYLPIHESQKENAPNNEKSKLYLHNSDFICTFATTITIVNDIGLQRCHLSTKPLPFHPSHCDCP